MTENMQGKRSRRRRRRGESKQEEEQKKRMKEEQGTKRWEQKNKNVNKKIGSSWLKKKKRKKMKKIMNKDVNKRHRSTLVPPLAPSKTQHTSFCGIFQLRLKAEPQVLPRARTRLPSELASCVAHPCTPPLQGHSPHQGPASRPKRT